MTKTPQLPRIITWTSVALLFALVIVKTFFVGYYRIPQNGMYPTLPAGSHLLTSRRPYANPSQVTRGDIIVFMHEEGGQSYNYIWRVIGLPGDTIVAVGDSLTINGQAVSRERIREEAGAMIFREHIGNAVFDIALNKSPEQQPPDASLTVPPEQFFVMGDNRFIARDSRYLGPVAFSSIIGKKL